MEAAELYQQGEKYLSEKVLAVIVSCMDDTVEGDQFLALKELGIAE